MLTSILSSVVAVVWSKYGAAAIGFAVAEYAAVKIWVKSAESKVKADVAKIISDAKTDASKVEATAVSVVTKIETEFKKL